MLHATLQVLANIIKVSLTGMKLNLARYVVHYERNLFLVQLEHVLRKQT